MDSGLETILNGMGVVLKGGIRVGLVLLLVGIIYTTLDFSGQRSQKHHRPPITQKIEHREGKKYAVLVNVAGDKRFQKNIEFAYQSLIRAGLPAKDIYVLQKGKKQPNYVRGEASKENLKNVFSELKQKITTDDMVVLYATGHGIRRYLFFGESVLLGGVVDLIGENITSSELLNFYKGINPNYSLTIFSQCQGDDFASKFGYNNTIGVCASKKGKGSRADDWKKNDGFDIQLFSAIGGQTPNGQKVDADLNNDRLVSIEEVFDYTSNNNSHTKPKWYWYGKQTPQLYWQNVDPAKLYIRCK